MFYFTASGPQQAAWSVWRRARAASMAPLPQAGSSVYRHRAEARSTKPEPGPEQRLRSRPRFCSSFCIPSHWGGGSRYRVLGCRRRPAHERRIDVRVASLGNTCGESVARMWTLCGDAALPASEFPFTDYEGACRGPTRLRRSRDAMADQVHKPLILQTSGRARCEPRHVPHLAARARLALAVEMQAQVAIGGEGRP